MKGHKIGTGIGIEMGCCPFHQGQLALAWLYLIRKQEPRLANKITELKERTIKRVNKLLGVERERERERNRELRQMERTNAKQMR